MPNTDDAKGPFSWQYVVPPPPPPPPPGGPIVLRQIMAVRGDRRGFPFTLPSGVLARLDKTTDIKDIELYPYEPDPITFREKYYYNTTLNRIYVKIDTKPKPVWRPTVE